MMRPFLQHLSCIFNDKDPMRSLSAAVHGILLGVSASIKSQAIHRMRDAGVGNLTDSCCRPLSRRNVRIPCIRGDFRDFPGFCYAHVIVDLFFPIRLHSH